MWMISLYFQTARRKGTADKDIGEMKKCLAMSITRNQKEGKIFINQKKYSTEILSRCDMAHCKLVKIPIES